MGLAVSDRSAVEPELCGNLEECICISGNPRSMVATDADPHRHPICICLNSLPTTSQVVQVIHAHHIRKIGRR